MLNFVRSRLPVGLKLALHKHLSPRAFDRRRKVALLRQARYAEVGGHKGVIRNYYFHTYFPNPRKSSVDFLYTKGSINCAWVEEQHELSRAGAPSGHFDFDDWLSELLGLVRSGGSVVLLPSMPRQATNIIDKVYDLDTYYWCRDIEAYKRSHFSRTLERHGFKAHQNVAGLTHPQAFPLAFVAHKS